jgi:hypothetical protein
MTDERTMAALRELANKQKAAVNAAEEICTCAHCQQARAKKEISQCDKNRLLEYLPSRIIGNMPGHIKPELSPNYESFRLGKARILT